MVRRRGHASIDWKACGRRFEALTTAKVWRMRILYRLSSNQGGGLARQQRAHANVSRWRAVNRSGLGRWAAAASICLSTCFGLAAFWASPLTFSQDPAPAQEAPTIAYLLVIDHSGSMNTPLPDGSRTRWQEMQRQACDLVRRIPLGSHVWLAVFNHEVPAGWVAPFRTEQDRQALIEKIQNGFGKPDGGTALYDTLAKAFEEARRLSQLNPNRMVGVYAYTDGKDESSKKWNPESLAREFQQIVNQNKNVWIFYTRAPGDGLPLKDILPGVSNASEGQFKSPLPLSLVRSQYVLRNAVLEPRQTLTLEFLAENAVWDLVPPTVRVEAEFQPAGNQPIRVRATPFALRKGPIEVELEVENPKQLSLEESYQGVLLLKYPDVDPFTIKAPDRVEIQFQKGERIQIFDIRPRDDATFVVGKPVLFFVNVESGAKVLWDFGDGHSGTGYETSHTYHAPGQYQVSVTVGEPPRGPTTKSININVIELAVLFDPPKHPIFLETLCQLRAKARGPIERLDWWVDGVRYEGEQVTNTNEWSLEFRFDKDGDHKIKLAGYSKQAAVESDEYSVKVYVRPNVVITKPQPEQTLLYGEPATFEASVQGAIIQVRFVIWEKVGKETGKQPGPNSSGWQSSGQAAAAPAQDTNDPMPLVNVICPVVDGKATFQHVFADAYPAKEFVIKAVGILSDAYQEAGTFCRLEEPRHEVTYRVDYPVPSGKLEGPNAVSYGKAAEFRVSVNDAGRVEKVDWDFGDGDKFVIQDPSAIRNPSGVTISHTYDQTGNFPVTAVVYLKGNRRFQEKINVSVSATPPQAQGQLLVGGRPAQRVYVGDTINLENKSTGDVVAHEWYVDGKKLETNTLTFQEPGKKRIELVAIGPTQYGTNVAPRSEAVFSIEVFRRPNHALFVLLAVAVAAGWGAGWHLLRGNKPRAWKILWSLGKPPDEYCPSHGLARNWRWVSKKAVVPMANLLGSTHDYWATGEGSRERLTVQGVKAGGDLRPVVEFSGTGNPQVQFDTYLEDQRRIIYQLKDHRCPEADYRHVYLELLLDESSSVLPWVLHTVLLAVAAVLLVCAWQWVYR
ncbi:MAG: hypothetical protein KatS3mg110_3301 [Pirellulaceae bacterium]|nr:MAG: hypothetical protein KatS3mg110_3301 [Pirellulaceae bacterium]